MDEISNDEINSSQKSLDSNYLIPNIAFGIFIFILFSMGIILDIIPTLEKLGVDNWITNIKFLLAL